MPVRGRAMPGLVRRLLRRPVGARSGGRGGRRDRPAVLGHGDCRRPRSGAAVVGILVYATRSRRRVERASSRPGSDPLGRGGYSLAAALALLLGYALWLMPDLRPWFAQAEAGRGFASRSTGEQFWWRVAYHPAETARRFDSANEIRLPVGERVEFALNSTDVIHSFWIPALGGKMDMIPGRTNRLSLLGHKARDLSRPLCRILRHLACADGVLRRRHGAGRFPTAGCADQADLARRPRSGGDLFLRAWLRRLPSRRRHRSGGRSARTSRMSARATRSAPASCPMTRRPSPASSPTRMSSSPARRCPASRMLPEADIAAIAAYLKGLE